MSSPSARPLVIAHRGASAYRPENTLAAYELAVEQRADMIEIDLHLTSDQAVVIAHDADLEHFGAEGQIAEQSLAEMRSLDAAHGWDDHTATVPTLDEVLDDFGERIPFNLEIKWARSGDYPGLERMALDALHARGLLERTLFSSFRDSILERLRQAEPSARLATLVDPRRPEDPIGRAKRAGSEAVNPHFLLATPELIEAAHGEGLSVYAYTVDELDWMKRLIDRGVDGLFTNRPDRMRALLEA